MSKIMRFLYLACGLLALSSSSVLAQQGTEFPVRPMRIITGYLPGGVSDTIARVMAFQLGEQLGQRIIIDGRPGAGGSLAMELAANATPDGHTLFLGQPVITISPNFKRKLSYDPLKAFAPISLIGLGATMLTLLSYKLHMIDHFIAEQGRKQLHEVPIWLEIGQPGPYIRYCGSRKQLADEGANPDKFGAVEVCDPQRMMNWAMLQQSDVLHELALAYYDIHVARNDSELGKKIQAAYEQARKDGKYKSVLRFDGQRVPHPALDSEKDYLAELMETYFLVNDHYPFVRCELKDQDPVGYALIAGLWVGNPRR